MKLHLRLKRIPSIYGGEVVVGDIILHRTNKPSSNLIRRDVIHEIKCFHRVIEYHSYSI